MRVPRFLVAVWEWWKPIALKIGEFQSKVILTVLYVVLLGPFTPVFVVKDPLGLRRAAGWQRFQTRAADLAAARRQ
jgi:hypothetical protein